MNQEVRQKIQELRKEKNKITEILQLDLTNWDPKGKPGMLGLQRSSKDRLPALLQELGFLVLQNSSVFFMSRDHKSAASNVKKAREAANGLALDYLSIEKNMLKRFYPPEQTSDFRIITDTALGMNEVMFGVGKEIGALHMPSVNLTGHDYGTYKTKEDLVYKFEQVLERSYGEELKPLLLSTQIINQISIGDKETYQVLIYNSPEDDKILYRDMQQFSQLTGMQPKVLKNKKEEKNV